MEGEDPQKTNINVCSNSIRKQHIGSTCKHMLQSGKLKMNLTRADIDQTLMLVDLERKILYCQIPKAASTTWRALLRGQPRLDIDPRKQAKVNVDLDVFKFRPLAIIKLLSSMTANEIHSILNSKEYTKFLVVRHPFERLLSAYRDQIVNAYSSKSVQLVNAFHKGKVLRGHNESQLVDFVEFLDGESPDVFAYEFLFSQRENIHWRRQVDLCHPCQVDYDYVIKTETMDEDAKPVVSLLLGSQQEKLDTLNKLPRLHNTTTGDVLAGEFEKLSMEQIEMMVKRYHDDFKVFGYSWTSKKWRDCIIQKNNNNKCC